MNAELMAGEVRGSGGDLRATLYEKILAGAALVLLVLVVIALARGWGQWSALGGVVWVHLATVVTPVVLTPVQLLRRHGDRVHRVLGWIWAVTLFGTAVVSFFIRQINDGSLSFIHLFSVLTIVSVPTLVLAARRHNIARHRRSVRGLVTGALLIAGYFTLLPQRVLGFWLWG